MKRIAIVVLLLVLCVMMQAIVIAEELRTVSLSQDFEDVSIQRADPVVISCRIYVDSMNETEFMVTVKYQSSSIYVSSVAVQKNGGSWTSLARPTDVWPGVYFEAFKTYSFASGASYRLKATFNIDGYLYTAYSSTFTR